MCYCVDYNKLVFVCVFDMAVCFLMTCLSILSSLQQKGLWAAVGVIRKTFQVIVSLSSIPMVYNILEWQINKSYFWSNPFFLLSVIKSFLMIYSKLEDGVSLFCCIFILGRWVTVLILVHSLNKFKDPHWVDKWRLYYKDDDEELTNLKASYQ